MSTNDSSPHPITTVAVGTLLVGGFIYMAIQQWTLRQSRQALEKSHNCSPARSVYRPRDPLFALDMIISLLAAARKKRLLEWFGNKHDTYGDTYVVQLLRGQGIHTIDGENVKTAFSLRFDDWSAASSRKAFKYFLGRSIFMTDGAEWSHSRGILRPMFNKDRITDLDLFEAHFQILLTLIPSDGSTIDLYELFLRYALDVSSEFLFGESIGSLGNQTVDKAQLGRDIELAIQDAADRARYSLLYPLLKRKGVDRAVRNVHAATDGYVQKALARAAEDVKHGKQIDDRKGGYSFLDELARQTQDAMKMRDEATSLIFAGKDTSAGLLGSMWFLLSRHASAWANLLAEVDQLQGAPPSYEWIKNAKYLRYCEHEGMSKKQDFFSLLKND
jgi:cytochrome P450